MYMNGYLKVASLMPDIKVANPKYNIECIKEEILKVNTLSVKLCLLPELSITGNNLQSLYHDRNILDDALNALFSLLLFSVELDVVIVVSLPFEYMSHVYEVAAVIKSGTILGFVPKNTFKSNDNNKDYFSTLNDNQDNITIYDSIHNLSYTFPFSNNLIFKTNNFSFNVAFDLDYNSSFDSNIILNITSIPETIDVDSYIKNIKNISLKKKCTIVTTSPGISESSERYAYFGRSFICEYGDIIVKNDILTNHILLADIDLDKNKIQSDVNIVKSNSTLVHFSFNNYIYNNLNEKLFREFDRYPYINKKISPYNYSMHIINILSVALAKRMKTLKASNIVIGVSGGLDSTFALLVAKKASEFLSLTDDNIKAIFMLGLGTTYDSTTNVNSLLKSLNIELKTIDIKNSVMVHFNDIEHDINNTNNTYENAQARERTQVLMDIANDINGIVIGTGDLSEIALGFSTYNGDQMSMYNVNGSVPKTLIRYILNSIADENLKDNNNTLLANSLKNILHARISPELLPTENGMLMQQTEEILGNYEIHDFVLYNYLKYNFSKEKLYDITIRTFIYNNNSSSLYTEEYIKNCINIFFNRFYKSQFKRSAAPTSPDIGLPNLNSYSLFNMPGDTEIDI